MSNIKHVLFLALIAILLSSVFPIITSPSPVSAADAWSAMNSGTANNLNAVWGSSCRDVFAVGDSGTILHYNGTTWSTMISGTSADLYGVWGSSATDVYAVGFGGIILHYNGTAWSIVTTGDGYTLYAIWGSSAGNIFAAGQNSTILRFNGAAWSTTPSPILETTLRGIWGSSGSNVFIVGNNGTILHFNGSIWTLMIIGAAADLYAVWGSSATDVWAVGTATSSLHYNGSTWSSGCCPVMVTYRGLWGTSASDIFMVCHNFLPHTGQIKHYNGSAWTTMTTPACGPLYGIWGSSGSDIFAVGDSGAILHYGSGCPVQNVTSASVSTTLGPVSLNINAGSFSALSWISPAELRCSIPAGFILPYGMFSFSISNLAPGQAVNIILRFPNPIPLGSKYYKCINGSVIDCTPLVTRVNEYTLVLTLKDGGPGDADGTANGVILDPGGPAFPLGTPQSSSPSMPATSQAPVSMANVAVKSASLSATKVTPGTPVKVTASMVNTGTGNGSSVVKVYVNGSEEASQGITVNSGGTSQVIFDISRSEPGTYSVYVGSTQAGSFIVDDTADPNTILFISSALVFFGFVLGVIYIVRRRQAGY
jgi:hypothetical protein